jgi:arylsulfatase A-like enzyme/Tfp pilus assembly protein PilF
MVIAGCRGSRPTNLILISVDTLRPDRLGCYGYAKAETPNIDRLSRDGITFDDAVCAAPLTLPSHTTMLTGLSPVSHGVRDNANFKLADDFVTLAEVLRANGYSTGAAVGAYVLDGRFGLGQGFSAYDDDLSRGSQPSIFGYPERTADRVTQSAAAWLGGAPEPFFLFVHYYDPHAPYAPPAPYGDRFPGRGYDGEIAFTDHEIGALLAGLEERGMLKRTLVAFVSDHGEGFGEHGENTHGILLYDGTLKVPFILRPAEKSPWARKGLKGMHIDMPVTLSDLYPTVLEMLGLKQHGESDGRSLVPLLEGKPLPPVPLYFESLSAYYAYRWSPLRGVRFDRWKYIFGPDQELYNLADDPREQRNLAGEQGAKAGELRAALLEEAREEPGAGAAQARVSAADAQKLRALGYVSPSPVEAPELGDLSFKDPKQMIHLIAEYLEPAVSALDAGDNRRALDMITKLVEADPTNPEAYSHRARMLLESKDYARAEEAYEELLRVDPANSGAFFHLGNIAQIWGDAQAALENYQKALDLVPDTPEALANVGSLLLEAGMVDSAFTLLHAALETAPRNTVALLNLGIACNSMQMPDSALVYFRRVLKYEPANVKALASCAAIFVGKGLTDSSLAYFEKAVAAAPGDPRLLANLGGAYRQKGMLDKAAASYEKAIRLDPTNVIALYGLGGVRLSQGRRDDAVALIRRILSIDPTFKPAVEAAKRLGVT